LPRVELMEKSRSVLETPRAAIERGRSNPRLGIAAIAGALLLIAWIAWAIYVTNDNGPSAGLGVVLSWPILLAALAVVALPFVGLYLLVNLLRSTEEPEEEGEDEPEEDAEEGADEPEETDPDEEPPSGEKETSVSG
jgi:hypothetical protein